MYAVRERNPPWFAYADEQWSHNLLKLLYDTLLLPSPLPCQCYDDLPAWGEYASVRNKLGLVTSLLISQLKALKGSETEIETTTSLKMLQLPMRFFTAIRHHSSYYCRDAYSSHPVRALNTESDANGLTGTYESGSGGRVGGGWLFLHPFKFLGQHRLGNPLVIQGYPDYASRNWIQTFKLCRSLKSPA
jgi:hypothetical protein